MFSLISVTPKTAPLVENPPAPPYYSIGDWVNLNCSSGGAVPAARLTWFVNRKQVIRFKEILLGDPSGWLKPPIDLVWTVLAAGGQLLQLPAEHPKPKSTGEVLTILMGHPVISSQKASPSVC